MARGRSRRDRGEEIASVLAPLSWLPAIIAGIVALYHYITLKGN